LLSTSAVQWTTTKFDGVCFYLPFAHFGSSFSRIGSLVLRNKELPMLFLSHCGQLPV
jgi:hypothetical protein